MDVPTLDLRLLAVLDRLLARRSVGLAARELGLPQATLSRCLAQLRAHFHDPLFVRTREGMAPTPATLGLADHVRRILDIYREQLARPDRFDPGASQRTFAIAASDFGQLLVLPRLHARIAEEAPRVRLAAAGLGGERPLIAMLETGEADVAVGGFPALFGGVRRRTLFRESYVCLLRKGHPLAKRTQITAAQFANARHIVVSARALGHVHQAVEKHLLELLPAGAVAVTVTSFVVAALMAELADLLLTVPAEVAAMLGTRCQLQAVRVPSLEMPPFDVSLYWHERFDNDPAHRWLRTRIVESGVSLQRASRKEL
jgi:DNA-binding transcriptional LysR family regulator